MIKQTTLQRVILSGSEVLRENPWGESSKTSACRGIYEGVLYDFRNTKKCFINMYYIYILTNKTDNVLYIGMTNDIHRRIKEHKSEMIDGFSKRYHTHKLVYFEEYTHSTESITREKQLKGYKRDKKIALINQLNPEWNDLSDDWYY